MESTECPSGQLLLDYILGHLDEGTLESVADHVDHCDRCESAAKELDNTADTLMELLRASTAESPFEAESNLNRALQAVVGRSICRSASSWTAARLPEQFGRYRIQKQLGAGGMGSVFLAWDTTLSRRVALKIPHFFVQDRVKIRERFLREAKIAAQVEHVGICRVYDVGELNGLCFLAMEFIEGPTLEKYAADQIDSWDEVVRIVRTVAETMQELHELKIIHRDLKPSNVILRATGEPVIMDFGLARAFDDGDTDCRITVNDMLLGSPAYMSPEQAAGDVDKVTFRSDIYSLGTILFELLTGTVPFGGNVAKVLMSVLNDEPPAPSSRRAGIPAALDHICLKAMQKDSAFRFSSMSEFADALQEFQSAGTEPKSPNGRNDSNVTKPIGDRRPNNGDTHPRNIATVQLNRTDVANHGSGESEQRSKSADSKSHRRSPSVLIIVTLMIISSMSLLLTEFVPLLGRDSQEVEQRVGTIRLILDHPDDSTLTIYVDNVPVDAKALELPLQDLEVGKHNYEVRRNGHTINADHFNVNPGMNPPVYIKTRWEKKPAE